MKAAAFVMGRQRKACEWKLLDRVQSRGGESETARDRERETERERETDRERARQRQRELEREREIYTHIGQGNTR